MRRSTVLFVSLALVTVLVADAELRRLATGQVRVVTCPWDAPATSREFADAKSTAKQFRCPAILSVLVIGCVALIAGRRLQGPVPPSPSWSWRLALSILCLGTAADLATTLWFFHHGGIDLETHPAIRLFGYAYGRTLGPVLAKSLQCGALWWLSRRWPRWGIPLAWCAGVAAFAAAVHNAGMVKSSFNVW